MENIPNLELQSKWLTIFKKRSILDISAVLDLPLMVEYSSIEMSV